MCATGYEETELNYAAPGEMDNEEEEDDDDEAEDNDEDIAEGTGTLSIYRAVFTHGEC
jgi:hypothetical protein